MGPIAADIAGFFQPLDANQARAGRQPYRIRQYYIGDPAVFLKMTQDPQIDPVKFQGTASNHCRLRIQAFL